MKLRYVIYGSIPLLLLILGVMYPISGFDALSSSLVAWGTLMLAAATFALIQHSKQQEGQYREDNIAKENRDRKERLLNEINGWAMDVKECGVEKGMSYLATVKDPEDERKLILAHASELQLSFEKMKGKSQYMSNITSSFGLEQDLQNAIKGLADGLKAHIDCFQRYRGALLFMPGTKEHKHARENISIEIQTHKKELDELADRVLEEVIKDKVKLEVRRMAKIDIEKELVEIKGLLHKMDKRAQFQWGYNIGFAGMIASIGVVNLNPWAGLIVFILGFGAMLYSTISGTVKD